MDADVAQWTEQYAEYRPAEARQDALREIERGALRLFYLDISEVPELLVIEVDSDRPPAGTSPPTLPEAARVDLGAACIDPIHGDDCPFSYREALTNAVRYGTEYNLTVARHFDLPTKDVPDPLPSPTLTFLGAPPDWTAAEVTLRDVQPLFGGRDIHLTGAERVCVRVVRPGTEGLEEHIFRWDAAGGTVARILRLCLDQDLVTIPPPSQSAPPDHGRPAIILANRRGERQAIEGWDPPLPGEDPVTVRRFRTLYQQLLRFESVATESREPIASGPYGDNARWREICGGAPR
jgi:hypothetical protein